MNKVKIMDLDKIKESWNKSDIPVQTDESKIRNIIHSRGKTALDRLMATEMLLLWVIVPLISVLFVVEHFIGELYTFPLAIKAFYIVFCITGIFWQIYKRKLLKKIDIVNGKLVTCRKYFLKYKLCIKREIIAGTIFFVTLHTAFVYSWKEIMTSYQFGLYCRFNAILILVMLIAIFFIYRKVYYRQIQKIENSLRETDETENEQTATS